MAGPQAENIVVIGAGAAGLMAARALGRAGKTVTILEARERCGGRIHPLPSAERYEIPKVISLKLRERRAIRN